MTQSQQTGPQTRHELHNTCLPADVCAVEPHQMAKCACTAPPILSAHPRRHKTQTKAPANTLLNGHKEQRTTGGAPHKGAPRPRPSLLLCAEEWRGPGAAAVGCTGHLRRSLSPKKTKSGAVSVQAAGLQG